MNADRNWERNEPNERDSRGGSQRGFQYSDAYGPGGGAAGNKVINEIHCKNATFNQQGFPDSSQLLPEEGGEEGGHERGRGHGGGGRGRGGREEGPRGRFDEERDEREGRGGELEHGGRGQWEHGGHGKWEHAGHGGHGGRRGHHGHHGGAPAEELDANGQPIAGSVDANEMGMNAPPPVDANGFPIAQPTAMPVDYSSQPYSTQPMDYSAAPQPTDGSATSSDPLIAQLTSTNPDVAQVLTDAQTQMTPQGYSALSQLMQQNLSTGSDGTTALANSIGQLQQLGGQGLAPDVAALQTVVQNDAPNLVSALSSTTTGTDSSLGTTATTDGSTGATTLDASGAPATQSFDASGAPITQSFDASGAPSADTTLAQISQADPTMGQFIGALQQAGMSQSTYQSIESTVAQNLANGTDDNTSLQQVVQTLQQNPNLQQDYQVFQQVLGSFQQPSTGDTSTATTDATAPTSSTYDPSSYASTGYSTPTSAAV